jgi:hypothetical protein
MSLQASQVVAPEVPAGTPLLQALSSDERWAAWQAKGATRERAVRRKAAFAAPIVVVVVAVIVYALVGR